MEPCYRTPKKTQDPELASALTCLWDRLWQSGARDFAGGSLRHAQPPELVHERASGNGERAGCSCDIAPGIQITGSLKNPVNTILLAEEKTEGAIFVIPLLLDECNPTFERLKQLHWLDYFIENDYR